MRTLKKKFPSFLQILYQKKIKLKFVSWKEKIINILANNTSRFSFTTDIWTSPTTIPYMTVTVHFIDNNFKLCTYILDFIVFKDQHSGYEISNLFSNVISDFNLQGRTMGITTDNASNNDVFIQELLDKNYLLSPESHIRCFAHVLNLVAQEITSEIRTSIDNLREIIKIIRTSPRILEQFKKICEETDIKYVKQILDVVTRWNSTFEMLSTALQLKIPLQRIIQKLFDEDRIETDISAGEWVDIEAISNFLIPFNEA